MKFTPLPEDKLEQNDYPILPAGIYDFEVFDALEKKSKTNHDMIELTLAVFDEKGTAVRVWDYLVSTDKAQFKIYKFAKATGLKEKFKAGDLDADDCYKRTGRVCLKVENYNGKDQNKVDYYLEQTVPQTTLQKMATKFPSKFMTLLISKPQKTSHWYDKSGQPQHTTLDAKGSPRATTLRDARKHGWLPSVTSILDIIAKPGLHAWIVDQAILAALTLPRLKGESDDAFAQRVGQDMDVQRDKAASLGSEIHAAIANHLQGGVPTGAMVRYVDAFKAWANDLRLEAIYSERSVVSLEHGYAGCLDLYARTHELGRVLVDLKTQKVKGKPNFYDTWPLQLVAYREALKEQGEHVDECLSLVIDTETAQAEMKIWHEDELSFAAFQSAFRVWQYVKDYDPNNYKNQ